MPATGLTGPFQLNAATVDWGVTSTSPGAYALGRHDGNTFYVAYVGRADHDVAGRLKNWVGTKYTHFQFGYCMTAVEAFQKECRLFHDFGGTAQLDNDIHPDRPSGSNVACPVCPPSPLQGLMGFGFGR